MTLRKILLASAATLVVLAGNAFAATANEDAIAERLKPYGSVCLVGDACADEVGGAAAGAVAAGGARAGADIYGTYCTACHGSGVLGAPVTGDTAAWQARLDSHAGDMDALVQSAITGLNAMPPKGTCGDCSAEEIEAAIEHMAAF